MFKRILFITLVVFLLSFFNQERATLEEGEGFFEFLHDVEISSEEILGGEFYSMVDEDGNILLETGRKIFVGDEFLTADNDLFRVHKVENRKAYAKFIKEVDLNKYRRQETLRVQPPTSPGLLTRLSLSSGLVSPPPEALPSPTSKLIGIYHTHNAESFVPTDGTYSIDGKGGIHEVGKAFKAALEERGINVIHDETLHLPHDRGAYRRSRETAQRLLARGPDVIFDVHRDAAPMHAYAVEIEDEWVTKVMFVVGRQNQNFTISKNFAYDLKGHADYIQPGLIKGVFKAQGNYNQDLTPLNLLLEVGGHENSREAAEEGIRHFAEVVDYYFYGSPETEIKGQVPPAERVGLIGGSALKVVLGVTGFFIIGGFAFLWINAGSKEEFIKIILNWKDRSKESVIKSINFIKEKFNRLKMK